METFYASVSGIVAAFGGLTFFYVMLRRDIQKMATGLEGDILRVEDRVIDIDDRLREVAGDMQAVKYQLRINEGPPADPAPTQTPASPIPSMGNPPP